jgi:spermidine/putrescine transport system ATP-binding protein
VAHLDLDFDLPLPPFTVSAALSVGAETVALVGPSGAGKTTVLRAIAGLARPAHGHIRLDDRAWFDAEAGISLAPEERSVGLVFQDYALFPHLNLRDNVAFGLKIKRVGRAERRRRADEMLERMALPGLGDRRIAEISGGQQQRVALARALINHPRVLLLDEPLGALDLKLRRAMQLELKAIQRDVGISFVYVTHDQEEALAMADRIAVMSAGKALQIGSPREIYDDPANRFVADFIGESSFLRGEPSGPEGELVTFVLPGGGQLLASPGLVDRGHAAVAMVRPEHVEVKSIDSREDALGGSMWNRVDSTVAELEYGGSDVHYFLDTAGGDRIVSRMPAGAETFAPGTRVYACFPAARTVLVQADAAIPNPETGGRPDHEDQ